MKFKKILIIILSVALLSCFAVSTFATDASIAATIPEYGFYISPGDYVFNHVLTQYTIQRGFYFPFSMQDVDYVGFVSASESNYSYIISRVPDYSDLQVYSNGVWLDSIYRYITVTEGFYIYDLENYQWWMSNVTRVDSGYDNNLLDGILSSFTFIGEWIAGAANAVTPMFWDGEALTVVGTLSVAGLSFAVVFLLIALVSSFMKFRS